MKTLSINDFDFDFKREKYSDEYFNTVEITPKKDKYVQLTKKLALDLLVEYQNQFVEGSPYQTFKPVAGIRYYSVYGWTSNYVTTLFAKIEDFEAMKETFFTSEPKGEFYKGRSEYVY